ncbi:MAG: ArnT family glycosyltransferase, partial [Anaerolineae bacterium]
IGSGATRGQGQLGLMGWLTAVPVWTLLIGLGTFGCWVAISMSPLSKRRLPFQIREAAILTTAGFVILLALVALAPSTGNGMAWDGLMYHLPTIAAWIHQGRIAPVPSIPFSNYPMGLNLLFVPGMMAGGQPETAQLVHLSTGILAMLATYLLARQLIAKDWDILAALSFWLLPLVQQEATWPMNDLGLVFYATLALLALVRWQKEPSTGWLVVSGAMVGFAASVKVTAVFPVAALSILVLALSWRAAGQGWRRVLRIWLAFGLPLALVGGWWYLKNLIQLGNPFFPFLFDYFGGAFWTEAANERFRLSQVGRGLQLPLWAQIVLILAGLVYLIGLIRFVRLKPAWKILLTYPVMFGLSWLMTESPQSRYLLPLFPVFLVIFWGMVAFALEYVPIAVRPSLFYLLMLLGVLLSAGLVIRNQQAELAVALGRTERETYLTRGFYMYPAYQFANSQLPSHSKLLIFPEDRTYYLDREYLWGDPISQGVIEYADYDTAAEFLADLQDQDITHIVLSQPAYQFFVNWESHDARLVNYMKTAHQLLVNLTDTQASLVFEQNGVEIYALP